MSIKDSIKEKMEDARVKADIRLWQMKEWAKANPEQAATIACTAIGAIGIMIRRSYSAAKIRQEQRLKDRYIYDRSLGRYWTLKRKLTPGEQVAIESMRKTGLGYGEILTRLKLL